MTSGGHTREIQVSAKLLVMSVLYCVGLEVWKVFLDWYNYSEC